MTPLIVAVRFLLDTDTLSLYLRDHPKVVQAVYRHAFDWPALCIITVEELWDGRQAMVSKARTPDQYAIAYERLTETVSELGNWPILGFPPAAVNRYAGYKKQKLNVKANDMKIGAIAVEAGATVVTRNRVDFARIPGVHLVDWSV